MTGPVQSTALSKEVIVDPCPEVDAATRPAPEDGMGAMGAHAHEPRSLVHQRRHGRARHRWAAAAAAPRPRPPTKGVVADRCT